MKPIVPVAMNLAMRKESLIFYTVERKIKDRLKYSCINARIKLEIFV